MGDARARLAEAQAARANRKRVDAPEIEGDYAVVLDVTVEEYHADPCPVPSLSKSIAHTLVTQSPAHAHAAHPRLGGISSGKRSTRAMNDGELLHRFLLGAGKDLVVIDAPDYKSQAAQLARDEALADGKIPVVAPTYSTLMVRSERIRARCDELGYHFNGRSEIPVMWTDGGTVCRSLFDHLEPEGRLLEVKKTISAAAGDVERQVFDLGYDIQAHAYTRALARLMPETEGRGHMVFLFAEIEPPFEVVPFVMDGQYREIGALRWERALHTWRECLESKRWPGYFAGGAPQQLHPPGYIVNQEIGSNNL